jgi:hypothetical protein
MPELESYIEGGLKQKKEFHRQVIYTMSSAMQSGIAHLVLAHRTVLLARNVPGNRFSGTH